MGALLVVALIVVPLAEIWTIVQVAHVIGGWLTLILLLAESLLGAALVRRQGRRSWEAFRLALQEHRPPAREVSDGALVLLGGSLLLTPGFLTDIAGFLLLLGPTRSLVRRWLTGVVAHRLGAGVLTGRARRPPRTTRPPRGGDRVVEGEVLDGEVSAPDPEAGRRR